MRYLNITLKGASWIGGARGFIRVITFIKLAVLARLLTPYDFGLFGIASLILALLEILTETGINVFLLQAKDSIEKYLDTAWIISLVRGLVISLIVFVLAPYISSFFKNQNSINILRLTALIPLIRGFINPMVVKFQKDLEFNKEFYFRVSLNLVEFLAAVYFAVIMRSAESLVIAMVISAIAEVILSFVLFKTKPGFTFSLNLAKNIIKQGKWITGYSIFSYVLTQGDDIAVGKILGQTSLGIYQNAYKISTLPMLEVHDVLLKVTFPIYAKIKDDTKRLKNALKKQIVFTFLMSVIIGTILYLFSENVVLIVLGPNWISAVPIVRILAFLGTIRGISYSFNSLFLALEKQKYVTYITFVSTLFLLITIIPLIKHYHMAGAAMSEMIGALAALPFAFYYMHKIYRRL